MLMLCRSGNKGHLRTSFRARASEENVRRHARSFGVAVTELCENLYYGEKTFGDIKDLVSARDVSPILASPTDVS